MASTRTPEGQPNRCPVCGAAFLLEHSRPAGDACCPVCGSLVWLPVVVPRVRPAARAIRQEGGVRLPQIAASVPGARQRVPLAGLHWAAMLCMCIGAWTGALGGLVGIPVWALHHPAWLYPYVGAGVTALAFFLLSGVLAGSRWAALIAMWALGRCFAGRSPLFNGACG